jgi:hypothetical protein
MDIADEQVHVNAHASASPQRHRYRFISYDASQAGGSASRSLQETQTQKTTYEPLQINADVESRQLLFPVNEENLEPQELMYIYPDANPTHIYTNGPRTFESLLCTSTALNPEVVQTTTREVDVEMENSLDISLQNALHERPFDQGYLSALNWLPTNPLSDPDSTVPLMDGLLSQPNLDWWCEVVNDPTFPAVADGDQLYNHLPDPPQNLPVDTPSDLITEFPELYSPSSQDVSPYSESYRIPECTGGLYVDGEGGRRPKYSRNKRIWSNRCGSRTNTVTQARNNTHSCSPSFLHFDFRKAQNLSHEAQMVKPIGPASYARIRDAFDRLCCSEAAAAFAPFGTKYFFPPDILTSFARQYIDSIQPTYSILHLPTLDFNKEHWILTLAVCALGCNTIGTPEAGHCTLAFHEFARRGIQAESGKYSSDAVPLWFLQAMLLNCIGLLHSEGDRAKEHGLSLFGDVVRLTKREMLLADTRETNRIRTLQGKRVWKTWVEQEARRRTGYFVWLVDCTLAYTFDVRVLLSLNDAQATLPSHESLWTAGSEEDWRRLSRKSSATNIPTKDLSLVAATEALYIEKRLVPGIGELSHILLIHALCQRVWEVSDYLRSPLSCWNPTAEKKSRDDAIPAEPLWLPGLDVYSKWRNSTCDCLDTLHWSANAKIAKAAGLEHPTVLHLHTARLVLLVPFRQIKALAISLGKESPQRSDCEHIVEWQYVCRWVKHDQYKARLAVIHAGSVLWYIRRHSTIAFHEPVAVFLATLTLWAYGLAYQRSPPTTSEADPSRSHSDVLEPATDPTFINLDRPCDDEIVDLFVRVGHTMQGYVTGVGDVCGPYGPSRILKEGVRALSGLTSAWGIAHEYIEILSRLRDRALSSPASVVSGGN